jgi:hypothetical protein
MSTQTTSEYMLLFRSTDWHTGLSPEEIQQFVNQMKAWFDRLTAEGKAKTGKPLFHEGKIVSQKNGRSVVDGSVCRIQGSDRWLLPASSGQPTRSRGDRQRVPRPGVRRYRRGPARCSRVYGGRDSSAEKCTRSAGAR